MRRYIVGVLFAALFLAACGSGSEPIADAPVEAAAEPIPASPLEASLGFASEPGRRQYQLIAMQRSADAQIVQCMQNAGFFYAVGPADESLRSGAFVGDGSREWTSVHGLGITTSFLEALGTSRESVDPAAANLEYVSTLDSAQASNYDLALVGQAETTEAAAEYRPAGCWGEAFTELVQRLTFVAEFEDELASMNSRLDSDPRVKAFDKTWAECMSAAGHSYRTQRALVDDIYARLLRVDLAPADEGTGVAGQQALDDLLVFEQQVGLTSYDCRASFRDDLTLLRNDYEAEFLDDNRFRISEMQAGG